MNSFLEPVVVESRNTYCSSILKDLRMDAFDNIVISPGPGNPHRSSDVGFSRDIILANDKHIPILGVCLGHQLLATAFGGWVIKAKEPIHGRMSVIKHDNSELYRNIIDEVGQFEFPAVR